MNAIAAWLANPWVERLGWALIHSLWQFAAVWMVTAVALRILRKRSADSRYLMGCAALVTTSALSLGTIGWESLSVVEEGSRLTTTAIKAPGEQPASAVEQTQEIDLAAPRVDFEVPLRPSHPLFTARLEPWLPAVVMAWCLGVVLMSARLLGGWLVVRGLGRRGTRPLEGHWQETLSQLCERLELRAPVRLLESARTQVPMVIGWWRPLILLPATAITGLSSDQLALILGHELAHIRRHDYLVNLVQSVIETVFLYHPAVWWISARVREERENCCDDLAVSLCTDRLEYARALSALEHLRAGVWTLAPAANGGMLLARMRRILGVTPVEDSRARGLAGTLTLFTLAFLGLALLVAPGSTPAHAAIQERKVVTGTVVTPDGKPAAGADVWLVGPGHYPQLTPAVIDQGRSDQQGHYRLVWDETRFQGENIGSHAVWAHRPGSRPARAMFLELWAEDGVDPDFPIQLTLFPQIATSFRILDPQGKSVAEARVRIARLQGDRISYPDELAGRLTASTGVAGQATIDSTPGDVIRTVQVTTEELGVQEFTHENGFHAENELKLRAVASVEGRVTADDPAAIRGVPLHLMAMATLEEGAWVSSAADVVSDDHGRFSAPRLITENIYAEAQLPARSIYRQIQSRAGNIADAGKIVISVPLERWVKVRGRAIEKGTGKPIEGVGIRFGNQRCAGPLLVMGKSDASGYFDAIAPRGKETFCHPDIPKGYLKLSRGIEMPEIATDGQTLPPIELERGATLRGIVVDGDGKPVSGARVTGSWDRHGPGIKAANGATMFMGSKFSATAKSNPRGEFVLEGIHDGANVVLQAEAGEARIDAPKQAAAGLAEPVKLVVSGANTVSLEGRVIDSSGKPVPDVTVQIRSRPLDDRGQANPEPLRLSDSAILTDRQGQFKTSRQIRRGFAYRAEVKTDDAALMSDSSPWLALLPDTKPVLDSVVLRRLRAVEGRVLDGQGQPVAGATVRQSGDGPVRTQTETDSSGRFRLPGVLDEPAFVFVEKKGYRFQGQSIAAGSYAVEITSRRTEEPVKPLPTLSPLLSRSAEIKLVHSLFDAYADRVIKSGTRKERFQVFQILTLLDPARALEAIESPDFPRREVAVALFKQGRGDALDLIAAITDPNARSNAYQQASAVVADSDKPRKLELLNESLIAAGAVAEPADRVLRLASLGRRFLDLGESEKGAKLLREGGELARRLPKTGWPFFARGNLAMELALIDLPAALELLKGTEEERDHERFLGQIAHRLAATKPAAAERVLRMMREQWPYSPDMYTQRVCYRIVTLDQDRALNLARTFMTNFRYKARALGAMALALATTRKARPTATALLAEAFELLERTAGGKDDFWDGLAMPCTVAASLLPIVERVDASLVREYLWRTLAMRPAWRSGDARDEIPLVAGTRVAAMVARYDREAARQILDGLAEAELKKASSAKESEASYYLEALVKATAFIAPPHAVLLLARLPESRGDSGAALRDQARLEFARVLAEPAGADRWRWLERSFLHVWPIDSEDDY